jgi:CheY-like chemotaxis protein
MQKVLIVEDEQSIRGMLHSALEKAGLQVLEAANGQEALALAFRERPDIIMLDVIMPKMHGIDMLKELQTDVWGKMVPVILLTNYAEDPRVTKAVSEKRCGLMRKEESRIEDIISKVKEKLSSA